tara:strand:+ start:711 stop:1097 length:387 start_codon:yes stop_codon:yes gene_type:complete
MKEVLMSHTVASLKKMVSAYNIRGYSKMKKPALIDLMTSKEHINKFSGIKARVKAPKLVKKTHKMPDGTIHTGKTHTKDSKVVKKPKKDKKNIRKRMDEWKQSVKKSRATRKKRRRSTPYLPNDDSMN